MALVTEYKDKGREKEGKGDIFTACKRHLAYLYIKIGRYYANGRLNFMAFLKPIINGSGYDFKEVQISDEKRLDLVITYINHKYIAELKLWHGEKAHEKGLLQLADYLDRQAVDEGYLLIFDHAKVKKWDSKWIESNGKKIFSVWV